MAKQRTRPRVRLIHWKSQTAAERALSLERSGYVVDAAPFTGPASLRALRENPPAAVLIDLDRRPSAGRDVAMNLRLARATRYVPLVFVGGDREKVEELRSQLPDLNHTSWERVRSTLRRALAHPPTDPFVPASGLAGYAGTPLVRKLTIQEDMVVALLNAPEGLEQSLQPLPKGVRIRRDARAKRDLTIWFVRSQRGLLRRIDTLSTVDAGRLWIAWPKRSSAFQSDLGPAIVREAGLSRGLVDHKICSIDPTWSALLFSARRRGRRT